MPFAVNNKIIGSISPNVVEQLKNYPDVFEISGQVDGTKSGFVTMSSTLTNTELRDKAVARVLDDFKKKNVFITLKGWRNEVELPREFSFSSMLNFIFSDCSNISRLFFSAVYIFLHFWQTPLTVMG